MLLYPNDVIHKRIAFSRERERNFGGGGGREKRNETSINSESIYELQYVCMDI